jgi:hypothetical protein
MKTLFYKCHLEEIFAVVGEAVASNYTDPCGMTS